MLFLQHFKSIFDFYYKNTNMTQIGKSFFVLFLSFLEMAKDMFKKLTAMYILHHKAMLCIRQGLCRRI